MLHVWVRVANKTQRQEVDLAVTQLGGKTHEDYEDIITHYVVDTFKPTLNTLCALLDGKPIINQHYFTHVLEQKLKNNSALRPYLLYPPEITLHAVTPEDIQINASRNQLFKGMCFLFSFEQDQQMYEQIIAKAGGECSLIDFNDSQQQAVGIAIRNTYNKSSEYNSQLGKLAVLLSRDNKRIVDEKEIVQAILINSTEHFCNNQFLGDLRKKEERAITNDVTRFNKIIAYIGGIESVRFTTPLEHQEHFAIVEQPQYMGVEAMDTE